MKRYISAGIPIVFITKLLNAGLGFVSTLIFARILGINAYGQYSLAAAWIAMLSTVALFGLDGFVIRKVAVYHGQANSEMLDALFSWSLRVVMTASIVTLTFFLFGLWIVPTFAKQFESSGNLIVISIAFLVPLMALVRLLSSILFGMQRISVSQLPIMIVGPVVAIVLAILWAYLSKQLSVGAVLIAALLSNLLILIFYLTKVGVVSFAGVGTVKGEWLSESTSFFLVGGAQTVTASMSIVLLGFLGAASDVGVFSVSQKISMIVAFLLFSANYVVAPVISRMHEDGRMAEVQYALTKISRIVFAAAIAFMLTMLWWGEVLLGYFGEGFKSGYPVLMVLVFGLVVSSFASSAGTLLSMTGHSGKLATLCAIIAIISLVLNSVLIPKYGAFGAAMATSLCLVIQNGAGVYLILKYVGVDATIIGSFRRKRNAG